MKTRLLLAAASSTDGEEEMADQMDDTLSHDEYERLKRLQQRVIEASIFGHIDETKDERDQLEILCCKCFVCLVNYLRPSSCYSNVLSFVLCA